MAARPDIADAALAPFAAPYAPDDGTVLRGLLPRLDLGDRANANIDARATRLVEAIRTDAGGWGGVEDFLHEYSLSTKEGLALMVLAEALLRVPDAATQDRLIEEKLGGSDWEAHDTGDRNWLVQTASWGLGISARIVHQGEEVDGILGQLARRIGVPAVRAAVQQAMRVLGTQFVLGETIEAALKEAEPLRARDYRYSYDMLGEGARTADDARRYFESYANAIEKIGKSAGNRPLPDRPGISVKLSALHPRYEATHRDRVLAELVPRLLELAGLARGHDLNLTVDAEEADRLELSLDVIEAVARDGSLSGWDGFGLAVQAYQKRAPDVLDWVHDLAVSLDRRFMVRLVKGAYWDTEIKRAQERGLADFPVFTRKAATDVCYLACARSLLERKARLFPQFATHNALTVATILEMAGLEMAGDAGGFEFQRLHGMGDALYQKLHEDDGLPCRIYAPVGGHRDLLAYLVRRLLENGANSSFVSMVGDREVPVARLLQRPQERLQDGRGVRHPAIPLPRALFGPDRVNSRGYELGSRKQLAELEKALNGLPLPAGAAAPIIGGETVSGDGVEVVSPIDGITVVGTRADATPEQADAAMASAAKAFPAWSAMPADERARILERFADLLENARDRFLGLLAAEGGKTLNDSIAEIREAADFARYYAGEARRQGQERVLPGPTGELDVYRRRGRGVFVCISPWNFPLAIFTGQVTAALAAGNTVAAKPSEQTVLIAFEAVKLLHEAGVPKDVLQFVPGPGSRVGARLIGHAAVAGVAFTGSTETAWAINRQLAGKEAAIVPLIAETGGINAMIVDATALPEQVSDDVVTSAFRSAGQRCSALRLLCVQEDVADRMIEMIIGAARELTLGDPRDAATDVGPVIDAEARDALRDYIADPGPGRRVIHAGKLPGGALGNGTYVAPHVISLERPEALTREIFGPVLHVARWKTKDFDALLDAIASTGYGLTLGVHSRIEGVAERVAERLAVGNVYVNRNMIGAVVGSQPFGGSGLSGTGPKAGGPGYLERFAQEQVVSVNTAAAGGNASLLTLSGEE